MYLFTDRACDSDMIYCVVKKFRALQFCNTSACMLKVVELSNCHKTKGGVFEKYSDKRWYLETLHWSGHVSDSFIHSYGDFVLIDDIPKTYVYDLSLVVTIVVDF